MIDDQTRFEARCWPSLGLRNEDLAVVVLSGSFELPEPGTPPDEPLAVCEDQLAPRPDDLYWGDPVRSSLRYEGQAVPLRPGTDVYLHGHAHAPGGVPRARVDVGVRVGPVARTATVFGDRVWTRTAVGWQPSSAVPFERMPLTYERCFGGWVDGATGAIADAAAQNPIGQGLIGHGESPRDRRLPNVEGPGDPIRTPRDRPQPRGFGPIPRHWCPRRLHAGTYDEQWMRSRAPLWPDDVGPGLLSAAAPGMSASSQLVGGEEVVLIGLHPGGDLRFRLPSVRPRARVELRRGVVEQPLALEEVLLEPDEGVVTLTWRTAVSVIPDSSDPTAVSVYES